MNIIGKVSVFPKIPGTRFRAYRSSRTNLWWSWEPAAQALYERIDAELWRQATHNPVKFLRNVHQQKLDAVAADPSYVQDYTAVMTDFDDYMRSAQGDWFSTNYGDKRAQTIAFWRQFGLHEALPIYSGGLGVLSGDHCKEASNLNLPFVGVGFLYPQGYFTQRIDPAGQQQAEYEKIDFAEMPVTATTRSTRTRNPH